MSDDVTLADWLLGCIAEDEAVARAAATIPQRVTPPSDTRTWSNLPGRDTPAHWGWGGGPFRAADHDPKMVDALGLADGDDPFYVTVGGAWDESEPTGARYDVATVPPDHDAARHIARHDPTRVLAECEAKRRIVELHHHTGGSVFGCEMCEGGDDFPESGWCETLRLLATVYADRPGYRPEWAPHNAESPPATHEG